MTRAKGWKVALLCAGTFALAFVGEGAEYAYGSMSEPYCATVGYGDGRTNDWFHVSGGFSGGYDVAAGSSNVVSRRGTEAGCRLLEVSMGASLPSSDETCSVGEYVIGLGDNVDWVETAKLLKDSACCTSNGVVYFASETNGDAKLLFTQSGAVNIPYVLNDGTVRTNVYKVGRNFSERPHRLFWTSKPYNAPAIDLSGKFVQWYGPESVVKQVWEATTANTSNIVWGIYFDSASQSLQAAARKTAAGGDDGPEGQFVLVYFDSARYQKKVATVVVDVSGPDICYQKRYVGERLLPSDSAWEYNPEKSTLMSYISRGVTQVEGDRNSPYLYQVTMSDRYNAKNRAVYAIAPNDAKTNGSGTDAPWRADIYWELPDVMDTLWPFEEDWYTLSWNPEAPKVVVTDDPSRLGEVLYVPTNYTASLSAYFSNPGSATIGADNDITLSKPGDFLVKLTAGEDVSFLPFTAVSRTDARVLRPGVSTVLPGETLTYVAETNASPVSAGSTAYIYEPVSKGRNWNPVLYHAPTAQGAASSLASTGTEKTISNLVSSVCAVSASSEPIELWWHGCAMTDGNGDALVCGIDYPARVCRYRVEDPLVGQLPQIVLASRKGSEGLSDISDRPGVLLGDVNTSIGTTELDGDPRRLTVSAEVPMEAEISVSPRPNLTADGTGVTAVGGSGCLMTFGTKRTNEVARLLTLSCFGETNSTNGCATIRLNCNNKTIGTAIDLPTNRWSAIVLSVTAATGGVRAVSMSVNGVTSATGSVAVAEFVLGECLFGMTPEIRGARQLVAAAGWGLSSARIKVADENVVNLPLGDSARAATFPKPYYLKPENMAKWRSDDPSMSCTWFFEEEPSRMQFAFPVSSSWSALRGAGVRMAAAAPVPSQDGVSPVIYRETGTTGRKFNYEHAFLRNSASVSGAYTVWAVRTDLEPSGVPRVLVMYNDNGRGAMRAYDVVLTNAYYSTLGSTGVVAQLVIPPEPLCLLDDYSNDLTSYGTATVVENDDNRLIFRDRKHNDWARCAGSVPARYWYKARDGFDVTATTVQSNGLFRWSCVSDWTWNISWPSETGAPNMAIGQTLTEAKNGLPGVWNMASCAVIYPGPATKFATGHPHAGKSANVVTLIDPVTAQYGGNVPITANFPSEYGFTTGANGTCQLAQGRYYFTGLPPALGDRFYIDTTAVEGKRMVLVGKRVATATASYLQLNYLSANEAAALKAVCKMAVNTSAKKVWDAAVDVLAKHGELLPYDTTRQQGGTPPEGVYREWDYRPAAKYALVANGNDAGWVVIVENNATNTDLVAEGDPVTLKVLRVKPELYAGDIIPLEDAMNKLSEKLNLQYCEPFGQSTTNYLFQWYRTTTADYNIVRESPGRWAGGVYRADRGLTALEIGGNGADLPGLQNMYYALRYRPFDTDTNTSVVAWTLAARGGMSGEFWSGFTKAALAEGWLQRVLNAVTPFAQRVEDFKNYSADLMYTMFEQIGRPYQGDVALNNYSLTQVGLLELYQTVFNRVETLSISAGHNVAGINDQLLLAASRLADLYMLLGAEAYSDAKNPLISQGLNTENLNQLQQLPSSTFCFQNQVRTLLDEELCLLRGRTRLIQPSMVTAPYYNRLVWNFTKGITEGEVAYVNNYGIRATDGVLTAEQAAKQYPQGHGDAYGHYLSAIKLYYRLLRNPFYSWLAQPMELNVESKPVSNDDTDEQKFADAAVKLAQTSLDVMDLTARKAWRDNAGDVRGAYVDTTDNGSDRETSYGGTNVVVQAFGYGEWATRGGLGAIYNWATVNALLPTNDAPAQIYADRGLNQITRRTATQLAELCTIAKRIQDKVNALDSGLNPLGLSQNAVPMDIDPTSLERNNSHFDQILERAERALSNASTVLDFANKYGARLQQIQNAETSAASAEADAEASFERELIAIYGTPFSGDIGTGKTYEQDYSGPDLYHFGYMNLSEYGLSQGALGSFSVKETAYDNPTNTAALDMPETKKDAETGSVTFTYSKTLGILATPEGFGARLTEGKIQTAMRDFLTAYATAIRAKDVYAAKVLRTEQLLEEAHKKYALKETVLSSKITADAIMKVIDLLNIRCRSTQTIVEKASEMVNDLSDVKNESVPIAQSAGPTVLMSPKALASAVTAGIEAANINAANAAATARVMTQNKYDFVKIVCDAVVKGLEASSNMYDAWKTCLDEYRSAVGALWEGYVALQTAVAKLNGAQAAVQQAISAGETVLNQRTRARKQLSNKATMYRYADMYNRVQRNNALTKYTTAYDTAQRYVWELAKVYDYETGLLSSDPQAGAAFLAEAIGARQLGYPGVSTSSATDKGLYDIVNRMKENWSVLKGRLGVNNPDNTTTAFSLRYENFRIRPDAQGDAAWRQALEACLVTDLSANDEFRRYCQPLQSASGTASYGAALVIPFATSIYTEQNFFGKTLQGGDHAFSSADYATKIRSVGVEFVGYGDLAKEQSTSGLAANPNVYLVPVGHDYMRAPAGTSRQVLQWNVVDQVLPLPYAVGSTQLDDVDWVSTFAGLDGTSDSAAVIRRHSTLRADGEVYSTRLVGRSVWNDRWLLVIPASELSGGDSAQALKRFIEGVSDIKLKIRAYARSGN